MNGPVRPQGDGHRLSTRVVNLLEDLMNQAAKNSGVVHVVMVTVLVHVVDGGGRALALAMFRSGAVGAERRRRLWQRRPKGIDQAPPPLVEAPPTAVAREALREAPPVRRRPRVVASWHEKCTDGTGPTCPHKPTMFNHNPTELQLLQPPAEGAKGGGGGRGQGFGAAAALRMFGAWSRRQLQYVMQ